MTGWKRDLILFLIAVLAMLVAIVCYLGTRADRHAAERNLQRAIELRAEMEADE